MSLVTRHPHESLARPEAGSDSLPDRSRFLHFRDLRFRVTGLLHDLIGVLAQLGRPHPDLRGRLGQLDGIVEDLDPAVAGVVPLHKELIRAGLLVPVTSRGVFTGDQTSLLAERISIHSA